MLTTFPRKSASDLRLPRWSVRSKSPPIRRPVISLYSNFCDKAASTSLGDPTANDAKPSTASNNANFVDQLDSALIAWFLRWSKNGVTPPHMTAIARGLFREEEPEKGETRNQDVTRVRLAKD